MKSETEKLLDLLQMYLQDITSLTQKFAADFHVVDRDHKIEDSVIASILKELSDATPRFTPTASDKEIWPGHVTKCDLLVIAQRAQDKLDESKVTNYSSE